MKPTWTAALLFAATPFVFGQSQAPTVHGPNESDARLLVQAAKVSAMQVKDEFLREQLLDEIGALQARLREYDSAVLTAKAAYPHTLKTLTALGRQLADDPVALNRVAARLKPDEASTVLANVVWAQADKGNIEIAIRTSKRVTAPEVRSDALRALAIRQSAAGDFTGARKSLAEASAVDPVQKTSPEEEIELIANGQLSRGDKDAAHKSIEGIGSGEMKAAVLIAGADSLNKAGDRSTARAWLLEALNSLPKTSEDAFIPYMAIPVQVELGELESAMRFADSLSGDMRTKVYGAIAVSCAEQKDEKGIQAALAKMKTVKSSPGHDVDVATFAEQLQLLNVSAALVDNGQFKTATDLLDYLEANLDGVGKTMLTRTIQLQRALMLAQQGDFASSAELAMKIPADSITDIQRGTALRSIALLETKARGAAVTRPWAEALRDPEDHAYACLGIAQALLGIDDTNLPYSSFQVH